MEEPKKKRKGLSGRLTIILAIILVVRIAMLIVRKSSERSDSSSWDSTYIVWSILLLVAIVGAYFWNNRKSEGE